ncbi:MAG: sigma-70 family RNA polymerase sigma factor [Chitinophagaceae bacterium]|nr:sigma-70 family RNA polymerase sigma factor [Chitinophagaceae bacterium]
METLTDWLQENPEKTLSRIYSDNFSWFETYVLQNSGNSDDARDIFQEGIAAAWINLQSGKFSGTRDRFNAYVRQICKFKWIDELRSGNRKNISYTDVVPERNNEENDSFNDSLQQSAALKKCFSQLGEKCQKVVGLFYYKKKSLAEIAHEAQNTEESIKTIKYRCMMQLRKLFLEEMKRT